MSHDVFISYPNSSASIASDESIAKSACAAIERRGIRCWIAPRDIEPGANWPESVVQAITKSRLMILIFSVRANRSEQMSRELSFADQMRLPVVAFRIEHAFPGEKFAYLLSSVRWVDSHTPPTEEDFDTLWETVGNLLESGTALSARELRRIAWEKTLESRDASQVKELASRSSLSPPSSNARQEPANLEKVVISYRRKDSQATTRAIFERLEREFGSRSVFMDVKIPIGIDFRRHIQNVLGGSQVLIAVVGPNWLGRRLLGKARIQDQEDWVRLEVETALQLKVPVIPVLVDGASMPARAQLPTSIGDLVYQNAAKVDTGRDFSAHMNDLIDGIRGIVGRKNLRAAEN